MENKKVIMMVAKTYIRGNKVYFDEDENEWLFYDEKLNNENVEVCPRCHHIHKIDDCDWCLRELEKCDFIISACCGHNVEKGYIMLKDGRIFREDTD